MITSRPIPLFLCLTALVSLGACDQGDDSSDLEERAFLFDMDLDEVLALHSAYSPETSEEEFVEAFSAPFNCAAFGHICEEMSEEGAIEFMRQTVELGRSGASPEEMNAFADQLSREIVAKATFEDDPEDEEFRGFGATYTHFQYFDGIRTKLEYGRTNPLLSDAYGWGKLIEQKQGLLGTWSKIDEPYKLYLKLRSVHHYQSWLGGTANPEVDSAIRTSSKYEGTYNSAGTDGQIYFKHYYDTPVGGWGTSISGPTEIHNYIYTKACSQGWSNSSTSSALQCWTDSASHF